MTLLAPLLQGFFVDRLARQQGASPATIAAYRDTFRLLLTFLQQQTGTPPADLRLADLDTEAISGFLDHLEGERGNLPRTRNARLAAIRSLFRYAALREPEYADQIARVLAIPQKRQRQGPGRLPHPGAGPTHWSTPRTPAPGKDAATGPSSPSPSTPGCGSANCCRCAASTSPSARSRRSAAPAKAARNAPSR